MKIIECLYYIFLINILFVKYAYSDLPIHVEYEDLLGVWKILSTEPKSTISSCGSTAPNSNLSNLKILDYKQYLIDNGYKFTSEFTVILSDDYVLYGDLYDVTNNEHRKNWKILAVYDENKKVIGSWGTIYDEGIEIRLGNKTYTAVINYKANGNCDVKNGDETDSNGETECYQTDPNSIKLGWYDIFNSDSNLYGCFYASKIEKFNDPNRNGLDNLKLDENSERNKNNIISNQNMNDNNKSDNIVAEKQIFSTETENGENTNTELHWHKKKYHGKKKEITEEMNKHLNQKYACPCNDNEGVNNKEHKEKSISILSHNFVQLKEKEKEKEKENNQNILSNKLDLKNLILNKNKENLKQELEIDELPKNFTWGDPFNNNTREYNILNQLLCGSCYIVASLYVIKRRIEIALTKKLNTKYLKNFDDNLSVQSIISCSFYDQGCSGGYPLLVGKKAKLFGIPLNKCFPYVAADVKCPYENSFLQNQSLISTSIKTSFKNLQNIIQGDECDPSDKWYIQNYNYIGGCYGCNQCDGEKIMLNEIFKNGPIVSSIEATSQLYQYKDGIYYDQNFQHAKRCTLKKNIFTDFNITGWEKVNHAIVLVGWGEEIINGKNYKYWIARNSWGNKWGKNGYFKIIRGINYNGIESQNVFFDPDFNRGAGKKILNFLKNNLNNQNNFNSI